MFEAPRLLFLHFGSSAHRSGLVEGSENHLTAASLETSMKTDSDVLGQILIRIVNLNAGEALLFAPWTVLEVENVVDRGGTTGLRLGKLGISYLNVRARS